MAENGELEKALYGGDFTAEDVGTFIALQWVLDHARIKVTDIDPGLDEVEVRWETGSRDWLSYETACGYIAKVLNDLRERRDLS